MIYLMKKWGIMLAGTCAGIVNGLFGAGGGMVLVPLLTAVTDLKEEEIFPSSVVIILPLCFVSLVVTVVSQGPDFTGALPYLLGGALGAVPAGLWGRSIPAKWLHRGLGALILWGGLRYLI
jgi:uncharacterized membrane protein YfcA